MRQAIDGGVREGVIKNAAVTIAGFTASLRNVLPGASFEPKAAAIA